MDLNVTILAIAQGYQIIFEDSDEEEAIVLAKTELFAEETVPRFTDRQFQQHFRMSPNTFENLLQKLHSVTERPNEVVNVTAGHPEIPMEKQVMITLWCLANIESFR